MKRPDALGQGRRTHACTAKGYWAFGGLALLTATRCSDSRGGNGQISNWETLDPQDLRTRLLGAELDGQPPAIQRLIQYAWARVALDFGILILIGEEHVNGVDRLICTLQEDGSSYVVERPPGWSLEDEARYVAPLKAALGGAPI